MAVKNSGVNGMSTSWKPGEHTESASARRPMIGPDVKRRHEMTAQAIQKSFKLIMFEYDGMSQNDHLRLFAEKAILNARTVDADPIPFIWAALIPINKSVIKTIKDLKLKEILEVVEKVLSEEEQV